MLPQHSSSNARPVSYVQRWPAQVHHLPVRCALYQPGSPRQRLVRSLITAPRALLAHNAPCQRACSLAAEALFRLEAVGRPQHLGPAKDLNSRSMLCVLTAVQCSFWLHSPAMRNASPYASNPPLPQEGLMPDSCMLLRLLQAHQHDPKLESQSNCTMHTRSLCWRICADRSF